MGLKESKYGTFWGTLEHALAEAELSEVPRLIGELERLKATLMARMLGQQGRLDKEPEPNEPLLSIPQVAERLNVTKSRVYELARQRNGLPAVRIGKYLRISPPALEAWLARQPQNGLDNNIYSTYSYDCDRKGTASNPKTFRADPGATGRASRRGTKFHRAAGTG